MQNGRALLLEGIHTDADPILEAAGLEVEWAGELMERQWGKASKGGMRPVNGPFGHTAFLLIAQRTSAE